MTDGPSSSSGHVGVRARTSQVPPDDFDPEPKGAGARILIAVFVGVPFLALLAAVPLAWGWGLGWHDIVIGGIFYAVSGLGVTVGFHRYFTHRSFKAVRPVHIALAVAGSLAMEGPVLNWVANHRRHHKYSDRDGDRGIRTVSGAFPLLTAASLLLAGGLWSMSWKDDVIARALGVSRRTVQQDISDISALLGARTRFQVALFAQQRGWLPAAASAPAAGVFTGSTP
jgi:hypothetical protein